MNIEELREYCLEKPNSTESFPFDNETLVFKVNNKMFLLASIESQPLQFNVKCNPEQAIELREQYPMAVLPGYHMNKKHWNTIIINGDLSLVQLQQFIDQSYDLVAKKAK
jgi:predicted DNA-binding protein (MmcQ/YjbR family)